MADLGQVSIAVLIAAGGIAAGGLGLLRRNVAQLAAVLMVVGAALGIVSAVALARDQSSLALSIGTAAASLVGATALSVYPRLRWRHPADFVALVTIVGSGALATVLAIAGSIDGIGTLALVQSCAVVAHTWWRMEVEDATARRALQWMALATVVTMLCYLVALFAVNGTDGRSSLPDLAVGIFGLIGPAMYVGATAPEVVDVRGLVVRSLVSTVALLTVISVFVLENGLLAALGADDLSVGALGVLAALSGLAYQPTRGALRGVVDQLLFGERPDPLGAASSVARRIGADPVVALQAIREALVLPYAALLTGEEPVAVSGVEPAHLWRRDLDGSGTLVLGMRPGDLSFSRGDEQVLRLVVPLLTQTLQARALAIQVLESRGATIAAVEEERRRLRRDLHDGLGPRLSGVAFTSDAARNLIRTDPTAAEAMVAQLRADTVTAIEEIRQLVYGMRPPALDELGLVPALRQQAAMLRHRDGRPFQVDIAAPGAPLDLPAAVEVAAYRIVVEALTNVARHSTSATARVCLAPEDGGLRVEVVDAGTSPAWRPGVGLSSMRERAAELGGTLEAGPGPTGGRVAAVLPL